MTQAIYPSLKNKRVLITGGGSGIGAGIVAAFVRQGAVVTFLDIDEADAQSLMESLSDGVGKPVFKACDLSDIAALQATLASLGEFDVLVNNAANDDRHSLKDITPAYWDNRMAVNLRHMLFCIQAVVPGMRKNGGGAIINLGSLSWHLGLSDMVLYETAKAGIEGMTRALARELGPDDIRVSCVVPGYVRTPRQAKWHTPESEAQVIASQCLKQVLLPEDVAAFILFLASDDGHFCTGHEYLIDGGWR